MNALEDWVESDTETRCLLLQRCCKVGRRLGERTVVKMTRSTRELCWGW